MFSKSDIMVSRGRALDRAKGGAHSWPSPIVPKLPSRDISGDDGHVAFGTESGFPKFPHFKKYLGGDSVSGKAVHVRHYFFKNLFLKTICQIWTLWFRLRTVTTKSSPNCSMRPTRALLQFPATLLGCFRELDSNSWYPVLISFMCLFALHVHWCA